MQSKICDDCDKILATDVKSLRIPTKVEKVDEIRTSHVMNVLKRVVKWANARTLLENLTDSRYKELE